MFNSLRQYAALVVELDKLPEHEKMATARELCRTDLFFLLWAILGRDDVFNQWILERCREVQENPDGYLDLWAREHYKSTIISFALSIQDILSSHGENPDPKWNGREVTIGIFSVTRPIAKGLLRQIKQEFETNQRLKALFPDILYSDPKTQSPKWSEDDGIVVKRKGNPKESTVEAWGIVDGQPTSKHFFICLYDDLVTEKSVTTPEMIEKTSSQWEMSINLGTEGGKRRYAGTIYHFNDTYQLIKRRGAAIPRVHACTEDGTPSGKPVLKSEAEIAMKYRAMGAYTFGTQMLLNPKSDSTMGFKRADVRYHEVTSWASMNVYLIVDPASGKKKTNDYTVMKVIATADDNNYYLLDMIRDRLSLTERAAKLFELHKKYKPLAVGYEQYGMQADIQHIQDKQNRENYHFDIIALGGSMAKVDRIKQLLPIYENKRMYLPLTCWKTNYQGQTQDLVEIFLTNEYDAFPIPVHDDMLDCQARILDPMMNVVFPNSSIANMHEPGYYAQNTGGFS